MLPPPTTSYQLQLGGNDAYRLYIDDALVIDQWNPSAYHNSTVTRRLTAGQKYKVVVEYYQKGGDARVDITGYRYVGGIIGHVSGPEGSIIRLERLGFEGTLTLNNNGGAIVGCIPNNNITAHLRSCYSVGKITGTTECGALSGWSSYARLTNCYARVNGSGWETGHDVVRGFTPVFRNCYTYGAKQTAEDLSTFTLTEMRNGTLLQNLNDPAYTQVTGTDTNPKLR